MFYFVLSITSLNVVAAVAILCKSVGTIILVACPSATFSNASNPFNVTYAEQGFASLINLTASACAFATFNNA